MSVLVYYENEKKKCYELDPQKEVLVGRSPVCEIHLTKLTRISRKHCRISYHPTHHAFVLEDLNSTNGTYLNGRLVEEMTALKNKDEVMIGDNKLLFYDDISEVSKTRPLTKVAKPVTSFSLENLTSLEQTDVYRVDSETLEKLRKKKIWDERDH